MTEFNIKIIIFSSPAAVYGKPQSLPITEDSPLSATNPYGCTKLMNEEIFRDLYNAETEWRVALLRYFNPVGAHKSGLIGEAPNGTPNNLMPYISQVAIGKLEKLHIYGDDYPTRDGTGVRDYIHVVDLAAGHIKALDYLMRRSDGEVVTVNLGAGKGHSVLEMVNAFSKVSGKRIAYNIVKRRQGRHCRMLCRPNFGRIIISLACKIRCR